MTDKATAMGWYIVVSTKPFPRLKKTAMESIATRTKVRNKAEQRKLRLVLHSSKQTTFLGSTLKHLGQRQISVDTTPHA